MENKAEVKDILDRLHCGYLPNLNMYSAHFEALYTILIENGNMDIEDYNDFITKLFRSFNTSIDDMDNFIKVDLKEYLENGGKIKGVKLVIDLEIE